MLTKFIDEVEKISKLKSNTSYERIEKTTSSFTKRKQKATVTVTTGKTSSRIEDTKARMQKWLTAQPYATKRQKNLALH